MPNKEIKPKQTLNSNTAKGFNQSDEFLEPDHTANCRRNTSFLHIITAVFKSIFTPSPTLFTEGCIDRNNDECVYTDITKKIEIGLLLNNVLSEREIVETIFNNFENKHISPFLLHSMGYKHEEIAAALLLPTNVVKSRIFYVQKRMQILLVG